MLDSFALVALERAINRCLARDPASPARLAPLAGQRVRVTLETPPVAIGVAFHHDGVRLERVRDWQAQADLNLTLTSAALERLAAGDPPERLLFSGTLPASGRTDLLGPMQTLVRELDLDIEGELARVLGRDGAHWVAGGAHKIAAQARFTARECRRDLREYAFEEQRLLVGRDQLDVVRDQLDELTRRLDRVGARVKRFERRRVADS